MTSVRTITTFPRFDGDAEAAVAHDPVDLRRPAVTDVAPGRGPGPAATDPPTG